MGGLVDVHLYITSEEGNKVSPKIVVLLIIENTLNRAAMFLAIPIPIEYYCNLW